MQNKENETNKIKNVMLNSFQHPLPFLHASKVEILKKFQDDSMIRTAKAFTLIELLVVVLIIGILAAVAVPQYQKAVIKSRYATLKNLVKSIAVAQEIYYLANGKYADKFEELDIDMPGDKLDNSTTYRYYYPWGECYIASNTTTPYVKCTNDSIKMTYQKYLIHTLNSSYFNAEYCVFNDIVLNTPQAQICKQETNDPTAEGDTYKAWKYQ